MMARSEGDSSWIVDRPQSPGKGASGQQGPLGRELRSGRRLGGSHDFVQVHELKLNSKAAGATSHKPCYV